MTDEKGMDDFRPSTGESDRKVSTFAEHLTPPVLTYVVRKCVLGLVLVLLFVARLVSRPYGFEFSASVSDRKVWKWDVKESLPRYRAQVEKVD